MSKYNRNKRELLKEKCLTHLGGKKCARCGISHLPLSAYDFHHTKGNKINNISRLFNTNITWIRLKEELDKCIILCKNCHSETHSYSYY